MLAQSRRRQVVPDGRQRQPERVGHGVDLDPVATRQSRDGIEVDRSGVGEGFGQVVHDAARDAVAPQEVDPGCRGRRAQPRLQRGDERVPVRHAVAVGREPRVAREPLVPERPAERPELSVVAHRDHDRSVGSRERLVRGDARVPVPHATGDDARGQIPARLVDEREQGGRQQIDLDQLTLAGPLTVAESRHDPDRRVQTGHHVHERHTDLPGFAVGIARDAHQASDRLREEVVAGDLAAADPQDAAVHDGGVRLPDRRLVQAVAPHHAGPEVLDHDVGTPSELLRGVQVRRILEVEGHAPLVPVQPQVVAGPTVR